MSSLRRTKLRVLFGPANESGTIPDRSVNLVVTSPPYPMIQMWDAIFASQDRKIADALSNGNGNSAFELMHLILDRVWAETYRILDAGGLACINIGDAVRTVNGNFSLYSNHSRILHCLRNLGFTVLPDILWRKQSNAPNKFMGSGMLPVCAYVTYEHEYILIVRKGKKREFLTEEEKKLRRESAFFWEERNLWFSDLWSDIKGTPQNNSNGTGRTRSAAFPFDLAYRLILMFSVKNDTVFDPFLGTGTTSAAAVAAQRNAIGVEIDENYKQIIHATISKTPEKSTSMNKARLNKHREFVAEWERSGKSMKYKNAHYDFPVMTSQERELFICDISSLKPLAENVFEVNYL